MALKFEFRQDKIVLDVKVLMFKEFTDIWNYDKTKAKVKANQLLHFVFLLCDLSQDNPLRDVDVDKREEEAKFRAFKVKTKKFTDKEHKLLESAVERYIKLNLSPEERLLNVFDRKADQLATKLETAEPEIVTNEENGVVSFVSNSKIIAGALNKLSVIRKNRETLVAAIKNEAMSSKVRGQVALSPLSRGLIPIE